MRRSDYALSTIAAVLIVGCIDNPSGERPATTATNFRTATATDPQTDGVRAVTLLSAQVVPPISAGASAMATLTTVDDSMSIHVRVAGLEDIVGVHLHDGIPGTNGPILLELIPDPSDPTHWSFGNFQMDLSVKNALLEDQLYIDVHTPAHPYGAVRGQISGLVAARFRVAECR